MRSTKDPLTGAARRRNADLIGRLKPGVTIQQATADLSLIAQNLRRNILTPTRNNRRHRCPRTGKRGGQHSLGAAHLFAAVMFVLLIACANVAGLMLTRASRRRPEMAVRAALGATRFEIMRQVLVESVVLSLCGGALGIALSVVLLKTIVRFVPQDLPRLDRVSVDGLC